MKYFILKKIELTTYAFVSVFALHFWFYTWFVCACLRVIYFCVCMWQIQICWEKHSCFAKQTRPSFVHYK